MSTGEENTNFDRVLLELIVVEAFILHIFTTFHKMYAWDYETSVTRASPPPPSSTAVFFCLIAAEEAQVLHRLQRTANRGKPIVTSSTSYFLRDWIHSKITSLQDGRARS